MVAAMERHPRALHVQHTGSSALWSLALPAGSLSRHQRPSTQRVQHVTMRVCVCVCVVSATENGPRIAKAGGIEAVATAMTRMRDSEEQLVACAALLYIVHRHPGAPCTRCWMPYAVGAVGLLTLRGEVSASSRAQEEGRGGQGHRASGGSNGSPPGSCNVAGVRLYHAVLLGHWQPWCGGCLQRGAAIIIGTPS